MEFRIREARTKAGLTQKELAEKLGIGSNTLCGYEMGLHDPKSGGLSRIADICGVTVDFLLGRESEKPPPKADDGLIRETMELFGQLKDPDKRIMIDLARSLLANHE